LLFHKLQQQQQQQKQQQKPQPQPHFLEFKPSHINNTINKIYFYFIHYIILNYILLLFKLIYFFKQVFIILISLK
jgi:hypothetical protein